MNTFQNLILLVCEVKIVWDTYAGEYFVMFTLDPCGLDNKHSNRKVIRNYDLSIAIENAYNLAYELYHVKG